MNNPVKILTLSSEVESLLMDSILKDKNIPHIIRSYHDSVYDGLWQTSSVWGHLEAPEEYSEEILAIYKELSEKQEN
ncbi:MAG TPA: hypothetical protein VJ963_15725 [Bacteroidales bacterium]|nr:hypothetical protein [Bacteroidales bacterium]